MALISADYWNLQEHEEFLGISLNEKSNMNVIHNPTKMNNYNTFFRHSFLADQSVAEEPEKPIYF